MLTRAVPSDTANGRQMPKEPSLLVNSVSLGFVLQSHILGFNITLDNWNQQSHPMKETEFGSFEITLPAENGQPAIPHNSKIKVC